jgi:hypothetical protein
MKCNKVQRFLPDYIGHELSAQKRQLVDLHLTECSDCRASLNALREVWDGLAQQPLPHKDERFWKELTKGVMTQVRRKGPMPVDEKRGFLFPGWKVLLPATAAAIAIIIGLIAIRGGLWGPQMEDSLIVQGDQKVLVEGAPDLSFGPWARAVEDPWEQEITLQEASLVAEALNTSLQPANGTTVTDVLTQLGNGKDLDAQLEDLTEGELEELFQLLSEKYPYS